MVRPIVATLAGGMIAFFWGFFSWTAIPWHQPTPFADEAEVASVLKKHVPAPGVFAYPAWDHSEAYDAAGKSKAGPYIYATVLPGGVEPDMAGQMFRGILINLLAAAVLVVLMQNSRQHSFPGRLSIGLLAGLFLGVMSAGPPWNWLGLPGNHALGFLFDGIIPWTLAGAAMAKILPVPSSDR